MRKLRVTVNGVTYNVEVAEEGVFTAAPAPIATPAPVAIPTPVADPAPVEISANYTLVKAPMPGKVIKVMVKAGDTLKKGDTIMILEAMKMQNEIGAPIGGKIKSIKISAGQNVKPGEVMAVIA